MTRLRRTVTASARSALAAVLAAVVLAALAAAAPRAFAQGSAPPAGAAESPAPPPAAPPAGGVPAEEGLPAELGPERPVPTPEPLQPGRADPRHGLQIGLGLPVVDLRSEALALHLRGGKPSQTGVLMQVDWVSDPYRAGYARQLYRTGLPEGTALDGTAVDALSFDADQLWGFLGFRPAHSLYLGAGLGWQRRVIRLLAGAAQVSLVREQNPLAGLLADWSVGLPFSLQLRVCEDLRPGLLRVQTASLQLALTAAF
jgi:hypothetical protein